jgi:hypothetical protein
VKASLVHDSRPLFAELNGAPRAQTKVYCVEDGGFSDIARTDKAIDAGRRPPRKFANAPEITDLDVTNTRQ